MPTGHADVVILRFNTSKSKLCISPLSQLPFTLPFLQLPNLILWRCLSADFLCLPAHQPLGPAGSSLESRTNLPLPLCFTPLSSQVQLTSQAELSFPPKASSSSVIHPMPAHCSPPSPKMFVKLTCFEPYNSMFRNFF